MDSNGVGFEWFVRLLRKRKLKLECGRLNLKIDTILKIDFKPLLPQNSRMDIHTQNVFQKDALH